MRERDYWAVIARWRDLYGPIRPAGGFRYDPTLVRAGCERCGAHTRINRHHKANDFFFALWWPDHYARQYIEFKRADCAYLCRRCHYAIERHSKPLKTALYAEFNAGGIDATTVEWCENWRAKFVALYEKWIAKKSRLVSKRRKRQRRKNGKRKLPDA